MADTAVPLDIPHKPGDEILIKMAAVKLYQGQAVGVIIGTGYATNCVPATAGMKFIGVAEETVDNSAGAAGDKSIRVRRTGVVRPTQTGLVQADVGKAVYWTDNQTVSLTRGNIFAGVIVTINAQAAAAEVDITNAVKPVADFAANVDGLVLPSAEPANPVHGSVYFKTSDNKIYVYDTNAWVATAALS